MSNLYPQLSPFFLEWFQDIHRVHRLVGKHFKVERASICSFITFSFGALNILGNSPPNTSIVIYTTIFH